LEGLPGFGAGKENGRVQITGKNRGRALREITNKGENMGTGGWRTADKGGIVEVKGRGGGRDLVKHNPGKQGSRRLNVNMTRVNQGLS